MSQDYHISDFGRLGQGGTKTKARATLHAIRLLKNLETENRQATAHEQTTLAQFSGWGTIADIFTDKPDWGNYQSELKSLLTEQEYTSARGAILNAHYTPPEAIAGIYEGLQHLGFKGGKILDPSMGATGMFEGAMPPNIREQSDIVGVELDSLSGRIARQLYPTATIHIRGFEDTILPRDHFDLSISNVPFCEVGVSDPQYKGLPINTLHDYFFVKSLDKTRPGGLVVFITSSGTMQSAGGEGVRELLAKRSNLVGAVRLPGNTFKQFAGTEVTADLIILQKLGNGVQPDGNTWSKLEPSAIQGIDGHRLNTNEYYVRNPHMMLGNPCDDKLHPGRLALQGDGRDIGEAIRIALQGLPANIYQPLQDSQEQREIFTLVPPALQDKVKPKGFVVYQDQLMQRSGDILKPVDVDGKRLDRVQGMMAVRDAVQTVFDVQLQSDDPAELEQAQVRLNEVYDRFVKEQGYIHERGNSLVFRKDPDYPLLLALENYDPETKEATKTDIFSKRTIQAHQEKDHANSTKEALLFSLNERGRVDLAYIGNLVDKPEVEVTQELQQEKLIFLDPRKNQWVPEDEYLSGNVREKLGIAEVAAQSDDRYLINIEALRAVQPAPIPPGDIEVRIGSTWVPPSDVADFARDFLATDGDIKAFYTSNSSIWEIEGDYTAQSSAGNTRIHGTARVSALRLMELGLNLKDPVVYDKVDDRLVVNKQETENACMRLEGIKVGFKDWIWKDPERTQRLTERYNELFNTNRPRKYNGSHLELPGSNPAISLRPHQKDGVWRILQEGNALLAHVVGAGKTFTMIAGGMEMRRLELCNKPMYVVPNHLLEQWAGDFKQLYPNSNILAATKEDASAENRRELMSRIATGNWDAVIVTHSAFGRLRMSQDAQIDFYQSELEHLEEAVDEIKGERTSRNAIKDLERKAKRIEERIDRLANSSNRDDTVEFEKLGVDQIFVDEAHLYKNLRYQTKMYNVAGLPNTSSDRAFDLLMKTHYLTEKVGEGRGVVFATGTPISNSVAELYTMQRYLQPQALKRMGLSEFDSWASTFGETVTAPEITPAGGYKVKTRFSRFVNIPELMNTFREVADIQTAEMLKLPVPELTGGKPTVVAVPATDLQLSFVEHLAERAEKIREVDPRIDNMLLITTDGRKAALDMRLISPSLPDAPCTKVNQLVADAAEYWEKTRDTKRTHLIFCDLGTPKEGTDSKKTREINVDEQFSVYKHIRRELVARGIPAEAIAFAQDYKTDAKKLQLQQEFNSGKIHAIISGSQLETGFNGQKRLGRVSHLTVPWRPDQVEQRDGRILRQGNTNPEVEVFRYVTQGRDNRPSFDSYSWQTLETKKKFISQIMTGESDVRSIEDVGEAALTYAEVKAIATGNPLIMEKATVDNTVSQLSMQKKSYINAQWSIQSRLNRLPEEIDTLTIRLEKLTQDEAKIPQFVEDKPLIEIRGQEFTNGREAGKALNGIAAMKQKQTNYGAEHIGSIGGFTLWLQRSRFRDDMLVVAKGERDYYSDVEHTHIGTFTSLVSSLHQIPAMQESCQKSLGLSKRELADLSNHTFAPFPKESELHAALNRQQEINKALGLGEDNAQATVEEEKGVTTKNEDESSQDEITTSVNADEWAASLMQDNHEQPVFPENGSEALPLVEQPDFKPTEPSQVIEAFPEAEPGSNTDQPIQSVSGTRIASPIKQIHGSAERRVARLLEESGLSEAVFRDDGFHLRAEHSSQFLLVIERENNTLYVSQYAEDAGDTILDTEAVFNIGPDGLLKLEDVGARDVAGGLPIRGYDRSAATTFTQNLLEAGFGRALQQAWGKAEPQQGASWTQLDQEQNKPAESLSPDPEPTRSKRVEEMPEVDPKEEASPGTSQQPTEILLQLYEVYEERATGQSQEFFEVVDGTSKQTLGFSQWSMSEALDAFLENNPHVQFQISLTPDHGLSDRSIREVAMWVVEHGGINLDMEVVEEEVSVEAAPLLAEAALEPTLDEAIANAKDQGIAEQSLAPSTEPHPQQEETPSQRTIAPWSEQGSQVAKTVAQMLHDEGIVSELMQGDSFFLETKNHPDPHLFLARTGDQLSLSRYGDNGTTLEKFVSFKISADGKLSLEDINVISLAHEEMPQSHLGAEAIAQEICSDWVNMNDAQRIERTWAKAHEVEQFSKLHALNGISIEPDAVNPDITATAEVAEPPVEPEPKEAPAEATATGDKTNTGQVPTPATKEPILNRFAPGEVLEQVHQPTATAPEIGFQNAEMTLLRYDKGSMIQLDPSEIREIQRVLAQPEAEARAALTEMAQELVPLLQTSKVIEAIMTAHGSTQRLEIAFPLIEEEDGLETLPDDAHLHVLPIHVEQRLRAAANDPSQVVQQVTETLQNWSPAETGKLVEAAGVPANHTGAIVGEAINQLLDMQVQHGGLIKEALNALQKSMGSSPIPHKVQPPKFSLPTDEGEQAQEIIRVAAMAYSFAGNRGQIQQEEDSWIAHGKHYDLSYNPVNTSFTVTGKTGELKIVTVDGQLTQVETISQKDVERFQVTEQLLKPRRIELKLEQPPAQTQAIAQQQTEAIVQSARAILNRVGKQENGILQFTGKTYQISESPEGILSVTATNRGEILRSGDQQPRFSLNPEDIEKFQMFSQRVASHSKTKMVAETQSHYEK